MTTELIRNLVMEIKNEVKDFYNLDIEDEIIEDFIGWYYLNDDDDDCFKPFDDEGIPVFDTTEREDFILYLEGIGKIYSVKLCS